MPIERRTTYPCICGGRHARDEFPRAPAPVPPGAYATVVVLLLLSACAGSVRLGARSPWDTLGPVAFQLDSEASRILREERWPHMRS